jgi:hypothetical protein
VWNEVRRSPLDPIVEARLVRIFGADWRRGGPTRFERALRWILFASVASGVAYALLR